MSFKLIAPCLQGCRKRREAGLIEKRRAKGKAGGGPLARGAGVIFPPRVRFQEVAKRFASAPPAGATMRQVGNDEPVVARHGRAARDKGEGAS